MVHAPPQQYMPTDKLANQPNAFLNDTQLKINMQKKVDYQLSIQEWSEFIYTFTMESRTFLLSSSVRPLYILFLPNGRLTPEQSKKKTEFDPQELP